MSESKHSHDIDEDRMIPIPEKISPRPHMISSVSLDIPTSSESKAEVVRADQDGVQEDEILVIFELPDNSQSDSKFRLGQTVQVLKSFVESEFGIPMQTQVLRFQGKAMMDPLSLLDYPEIQGRKEIYVRVEGTLPAGSKK